MRPNTIAAVAVLTMVAAVGTTAALPADGGAERAGALQGGLPEPVPDVVGDVIDAVAGFVESLLGGAPAEEGTGDDAGEFPTATPTAAPDASDGGSGGGTGDDGTAEDTSTATATPAPFTVAVTNVEECGETCRDVTVDLTNGMSEDATGVTVYTRIFAGESTDEADRVWRGSEDVGDLPAGETYTSTKRVDLSLSEGLAIEQADGVVTVQTTIETDDRTVTFTEQRQVA